MFYIHTLNGDHYDISLEALLHRKEVPGVSKNSPVRKIITGEGGSGSYTAGGGHPSYAEKSYREAVNIKNEFEPLFHAYQIMNSPVKTLKPDMKITEVWNYFKRENIFHAPVLSDSGRIIGIISDRDLLKYLLISEGKIINENEKTVSDVMVREVITADRITDIRRIALVMFNEHIGTMPILGESKNLIGIITRSDILHALINYPPLKLWG